MRKMKLGRHIGRTAAVLFGTVALLSACKADDATNAAFSQQCNAMMRNAAQCRCIAEAATENFPNQSERSLYYQTVLRKDTFNQIRALPDANGYLRRSSATTNTLLMRTCPGA